MSILYCLVVIPRKVQLLFSQHLPQTPNIMNTLTGGGGLRVKGVRPGTITSQHNEVTAGTVT